MTASQRSSIQNGSLSGSIAVLSALPMIGLCSDATLPGHILITIALPGIVLSAITSNNVHAFSSWLVFLFNWAFYAVFVIAFRKLIRMFREG